MFRFIETIRIENGIVMNAEYHNARIARTYDDFFSGRKAFEISDLKCEIRPVAQKQRLRIVYSQDGYECVLDEYKARKIETAAAVECPGAVYSYKFENRMMFESLQVRGFDEVIVIRDGMVTDSSFSNLLFYDSGRWYTPDTFLLNGTMRQKLLAEKKITESRIGVRDIRHYEKISFVNAMLDPGESCISTNRIGIII